MRLNGTATRDEFYTDYSRFEDDVISLRAGDDLADGGNGNDRIDGGKGSDRIYGGDGADLLNGGIGDDRLFDQITSTGDAQRDQLLGGAGNDYLAGGLGEDFLQGGAGNDILDSVSGTALGGKGNDVLVAHGTTTLGGGRGADNFYLAGIEDGANSHVEILDFKPGEGDQLFLELDLADGRVLPHDDAWKALDTDRNSQIDAADIPSLYGSVSVDANSITLTLAGDTFTIHGAQALYTSTVDFG